MYNFAIFAGYQDIFAMGDMGLCGLLGYPKNNGLLLLGVMSYTRDYDRSSDTLGFFLESMYRETIAVMIATEYRLIMIAPNSSISLPISKSYHRQSLQTYRLCQHL